MKLALIICTLLTLSVTSTLAVAETKKREAEPIRSTTEHSVKINDKTINTES